MTLQIIHTPPLENHNELDCGDIFKTLLEAGNWKIDDIAEELTVSVESVKKYCSGESQPRGKNRDTLIRVIHGFTSSRDVAEQWVQAIESAWMRDRINIMPKKTKKIGELICQNALKDHQLTQLPALFETEQSLPLATAFVELQLTPLKLRDPNPLLLESTLSLREKLNRKVESRYSVRKSPQDLIDDNPLKTTLILGPPGAGKSSLLRRMAFDIANNKWKLFKVPLFVEARSFWMLRRSGVSIDLLTYAVQKMLPPGYDPDSSLEILFHQQKKQPFILLVDGLDEISSDPVAVNVIYEELIQLSKSISWVVTARPNGVIGSLGSVQKCEVIELDDESIESLIDNWCDSTNDQYTQLDKPQLKNDIFGASGTHEMARNPFLLTALCYLKSINPADRLPPSRIEIYEKLLTQIVLQAQLHNNSDKILDPIILGGLQDFVLHLYNQPNNVIQIFDMGDWYKFIKTHSELSREDFELNIKPSRLLSSWIGSEKKYHFLHLSLQEHLVARALLDQSQSIEEVLERRFIPSWRTVFRFYGALLLQHQRENEFRELVQTLYKEKDFNCLSYLSLANIFADVGINDTTDWIGEDLREMLFFSAKSGHDAGPESMYDALALLDPNWFEAKVCENMDEYIEGYERIITTRLEDYDDLWFAASEDWYDSPYELLARTRTESARNIISEAFWGDNKIRSIVAAHAFASIATPSERKAIVNIALKTSIADDRSISIYAFARGLYRTEFVPFLGDVLDYYVEQALPPFSDALNLVADIGGSEAAKILENLAIKEAGRITEGFSCFDLVIKAVVRLGGNQSITILEKIEALPQEFPEKEILSILKFGVNPSSEEKIIKALHGSSSLFGDTLEALSRAADFGRLPSENIMQVIKKRIDADTIVEVIDLAFIESARIDSGESPFFCNILLDIAENYYYRLLDIQDETNNEFLVTNIRIVFDALERAQWKPAKALVQTILKNSSSDEDLFQAVISLAGYVCQESDKDVIRQLKVLLFEADCIHTTEAALAIGRINLEELFRLQSAEGSLDALEVIASESDLLIFDDFWVDHYGQKHKWQNPPKKIFYVYSDTDFDALQLFSHELSQYGFCLEFDSHEECVAYLIFDKNNEEWEDLSKSLADSVCPIIEIPKNLSDKAIQKLAGSIGVELLQSNLNTAS